MQKQASINTLLTVMVNNGASDLHMVSRSAPQIRKDGRLVQIDMPELT